MSNTAYVIRLHSGEYYKNWDKSVKNPITAAVYATRRRAADTAKNLRSLGMGRHRKCVVAAFTYSTPKEITE